jgi:hypothetical protein
MLLYLQESLLAASKLGLEVICMHADFGQLLSVQVSHRFELCVAGSEGVTQD